MMKLMWEAREAGGLEDECKLETTKKEVEAKTVSPKTGKIMWLWLGDLGF